MNETKAVSAIFILLCLAGVPVIGRVAEILWALTKREYDFRTKGRFNKPNNFGGCYYFWYPTPYILLLPASAFLDLCMLIGGGKDFSLFIVLPLCIGIEFFFWFSWRMLNEFRSHQALRLREKWQAATAPAMDIASPPEPDFAPCQGNPWNGRQIDFDFVYSSNGLLIAWNKRESGLIRQDLEKAKAYLGARKWFRTITESYYGTGIGGCWGVFLFRITTDSPEDDEYLWVVAGDIPATHFSCENLRSPMQVLRKYVDTMKERWGGEAEVSSAVLIRLRLLERYWTEKRF